MEDKEGSAFMKLRELLLAGEEERQGSHCACKEALVAPGGGWGPVVK